MKKFCSINFILFILFSLPITSQSFTVSDSSTPQQLIENVLLGNSNCYTLGSMSPSSNFNGSSADISSFGSFNNNGTSFDLSQGIILATGSINAAVNNPGDLGEGDNNAWDDNNSGNNPDFGFPVTNPTQLEFSFTPNLNNTQFSYVFASDEYASSNPGGCTNRDGFRFLIRRSGTAEPFRNIATLSDGSPVGINTIRPAFTDVNGNEVCPSVNESLFGGLSSGTTNQFPNYTGRTNVLQTPIDAFDAGQEYDVRIIIADDTDFTRDSAVFIELPNLDPEITPSATVGSSSLSSNLDFSTTGNASNVVACGTNLTLMVNSSEFPANTTFQWLRDGAAIGSNQNSLEITQEEALTPYQVAITLGGGNGCVFTQTFTVSLTRSLLQGEITFSECVLDPSQTSVTLNYSQLNGNASSYFDSLSNAENGTNALSGNFEAINDMVVFASFNNDGCNLITPIRILINSGSALETVTDCPYIVIDQGQGASADGFEGYSLFDETVSRCITEDPIPSVTQHFFQNTLSNSESTLRYFTVNTNGTRGTEVTSPTASSSTTLRAVLTNNTTGCENEVDVSIEVVIPEGEFVSLEALEACDDGVVIGTDGNPLNGFATFDLQENFNRLLNQGNNINQRVSFHADANLALCNSGDPNADTIIALWDPTNPANNIPAPSNYINDPLFTFNDIQSIGFRVENEIVCTSDSNFRTRAAVNGSFELRPRYLITNSNIDDIQICDNLGSTDEELADGIGEFDFQELPVFGAIPATNQTIQELFLGITNDNGYLIELYESEQTAINGPVNDTINRTIPFINRSTTNPLDPITEIFVKVIDNNTTVVRNGVTVANENFNCFDVEPFGLIVNPNVTITAPTDTIEICDSDDSGTTSASSLVNFFETDTSFIDSFTSNNPSAIRTYFLTENDAQMGSPQLQSNEAAYNANFVVDSVNTLFVRLTDPSSFCFDITSFDYIINRAPSVGSLSNNPIVICYDETNIDPNNPLLEVDITQNQSIAIPDSTNLNITYHTTFNDAQTGTNPLETSQTTNFNILDPQFAGVTAIWYRAENNITGCFSLTDQPIIINETPDILPLPQEVVECVNEADISDPNNRFFTFDLTLQNSTLLNLQSSENLNGNTQSNLVVQYYENLADANEVVVDPSNRATIADFSAYRNTTANEQVIFYRIESNTDPNCFSEIGELTLKVGLFAEFNVPANIFQCDEDNIPGPGSIFNLTEIEALYNSNNQGFTVTFHSSQADAENNINALGEDAFDENGQPIVNYMSSSSDAQVFSRVENSLGCVGDITPITLITFLEPNLVEDSDIVLSVCDITAPEGFEVFDLINLLDINSPLLSFADPRINGNPTLRNNISISFFENDQTDPATGRFINPIPANAAAGENTTSNYVVENTTEVIFIELLSNQGCFSQAPVTLTVAPLPRFELPSNPILICEDAFGSNQFDNTLTALENVFTVPEVLTTETLTNNSDTSFLDFTYFFRTSNELQPNPINEITAANGDNISTSEIFVVLTNTNTLCTTSQIVTIAPKTLPVITAPVVPIICDEDTDVTDGITNVDLSLFTDQILNPVGTPTNNLRSLSDFSITYFNASNTELIGEVLLTNGDVITAVLSENSEMPNCQNSVDFTITIEPQPQANQPDASLLALCDTDSTQDGMVAFNFGTNSGTPSALQASILGTQSSSLFTVTYYNTLAEAVADENNQTPIPTIATSQEYVAKVNNNASGCFNTVIFEVTVNLLPQFTIPSNPISICANGATGTDSTLFSNTLDQLNTIFNNSTTTITTPSDDLVYSFFFKAPSDTEPVSSRLITQTNGDNIAQTEVFVVLTNTTTNCTQIQEVTLQPKPLPQISAPLTPIICDNDSDGQIISSLSMFDNELLNPLGTSTPPANFRNSTDFTIRYFDTATPIRNEITETSTLVDGSTYTAEISDNRDTLLCSNSVDFVLSVTRQAVVVTLEPLQQCSIDNMTSINFTDLSTTILQNEPNSSNFTVTFHNSEAEAATASSSTLTNPLTSNNYIAKVTNNTNALACFTTVNFEVIVNTQPEINAGVTLEYCENETNLDDVIDGVTRRERLNNLLVSDRTNVEITYHQDNAAAIANIETTILQPTLFVKAVKTFAPGVTCETIASINLNEVPLPTVNTIANTTLLATCDTDGNNDGSFAYDFTTLSPIILGTQNPTQFTVSYHFSLDDAENNIDIPVGESITSGTYFIKVAQASAGCFSIEPVDITIDFLPNLELENIVFCRNDPDRVINAGIFDPSFAFLWEFRNDAGATTRASETSNTITLRASDVNTNVTLTVTDPNSINSCNNSTTIRVIESITPEITPIVLKNFEANEVTINVEEEGDFLYGFNDSNISNAQESNTFTDLLPGMFTLYVFDINGCEPASVDVIFVDYFPAFTPNGSGPIETETWHIQGIETIPETIVYIYNRYGKLLKTLTSLSDGWDGTYNGELLPSDDYWILIRLPDGQEIKDHITLKR